MPNEDTKILKYNHREKSMKAPFIIYTDLECLNSYQTCTHIKTILKNLTQKKRTMHEASAYSIFTNCSFDSTKNEFDCYRDKDCMKGFVKT